MRPADAAETAASLSRVIAAIEQGELIATPEQRHVLESALIALGSIAITNAL
jgi:hypothetical protein